MVNNVDPDFPGKPTVYPYYDPNDATKYANLDPGASSALNQNPTSATYVWGYMTGTVDTSAIPNGYAESPGAQQASLMNLVYANGTNITPETPTTYVPMFPYQKYAPSVGGFYDSSVADVAQVNPNEPNTNRS